VSILIGNISTMNFANFRRLTGIYGCGLVLAIGTVEGAYALDSYRTSGVSKSVVENGCQACHGVNNDDNSLFIAGKANLPYTTTSTTVSVVGATFGRNSYTVFDGDVPQKSRSFLVSGLTPGSTKSINYCILDSGTVGGIKGRNCDSVVVSVASAPPPPSNNPGSISFENTQYTINEGDTVKVPVIRTNGSSGNVSVSVLIRGIGATPGSDFVRAGNNPNDFNATIRWKDGEVLDFITGQEKTIDIRALADAVGGEGVEQLEIEMVGISGASFGPNTKATISIKDKDISGGSGRFSFEREEYRIREGQTAGVAMIRSGGSVGDVVVNVKIRPITASGGSDFIRNDINSSPTDFNLNARWSNGQIVDYVTGKPKTINIASLIDGLTGEGVETVEIEMVGINGASFGDITKATVFIEDGDTDTSGSFSFERSEYRIEEGQSAGVAMIRSGGSSGNVIVNVRIRPISATPGTDFVRNDINSTATDFSLNARWDNGQILDYVTGLPKTINIDALHDSESGEGLETVEIEMIGISGGTLGRITKAIIYIKDIDSVVVDDYCVYPGGNTSLWGWDNVNSKSCPPNSVVEPPIVIEPPGVFDNCVYPGGDTNQWGWDNVANKSCRPVTGTGTGTGNCVYPGGDTGKWGWDDIAKVSCRPLAEDPVVTEPSNPFLPADNCEYPGGDTTLWGWDNVSRKSCPPVLGG
jgi:hypothetical protein